MPLYNYNINIPLATNNPSADQPLMQINTNSINSLISIDHIGFNAPNGGNHKQVHLFEQVGVPATLALFDTIYAQSVAGQGELFLTRGVTGVGIQLTGPYNAIQNQGTSFLPGGIILKWGIEANRFTNATAHSAGVINLVPPFPNAMFNIQATLIATTNVTVEPRAVISIGPINNNSFGYVFNTNPSGNANFYSGFYWFAVGN